MNIHEYQSKQLLAEAGVSVPKGGMATSIEEAVQVAQDLGGSFWVVKAQIHAGGRGKAGGVKLARSLDEVRQFASELLGSFLVTHQTGSGGQQVRRLLIEEGCAIDHEYYVGLVIDRSLSRIIMMASNEGGTEIEEVAANSPESIYKEVIDPAVGLLPFQARRLAYNIQIKPSLVREASKMFLSFYDSFIKYDCSQVEINPLITSGEKVIALDAKLNFDDNALYRHSEIFKLRDLNEEDPKEIEASKYDLNYIALDGNIGCMVNGAGLAMATMDMIKHYRGEPANFLDVGGGATAERVTEAFKIILSDNKVRGIFVNIFGGIMRCDVIAEGIVAAAKQVKLQIPVVVRLEGTNAELGKQLLRDSGLSLLSADSMADGAQQIVQLVEAS